MTNTASLGSKSLIRLRDVDARCDFSLSSADKCFPALTIDVIEDVLLLYADVALGVPETEHERADDGWTELVLDLALPEDTIDLIAALRQNFIRGNTGLEFKKIGVSDQEFSFLRGRYPLNRLLPVLNWLPTLAGPFPNLDGDIALIVSGYPGSEHTEALIIQGIAVGIAGFRDGLIEVPITRLCLAHNNRANCRTVYNEKIRVGIPTTPSFALT